MTLKRCLILFYAGLAYLLSLAAIAYLVGFLADFGVPKSVNGPASEGSLSQAILWNCLLVAGFGLHHSLTARIRFKRWWTTIIPAHVERATYLYMTTIATGLLVVLWQPIPLTVWRIASDSAAILIVALYLGVWTAMFSATFQIGHLGFFGLGPVLDKLFARNPGPVPFAARALYGLVRHPISLGWMVVPWITPHMTLGQLVFALATSAYVLIATVYEENDLIAELGDTYRRYQRQVPAFIPGLKPREREPGNPSLHRET